VKDVGGIEDLHASEHRERLRNRWLGVLLPYVEHTSFADAAFNSLVNRYSEEGRYYHTTEHIYQVVSVIDELAEVPSAAPDDPIAVELAGFFHDIVYDTHASDNQAQSATLAGAWLDGLGIPAAVIEETQRLILLTTDHQALPTDRNGMALLDADLSTLGADPLIYDRYRDDVRREYSWMGEAEYRARRRWVLEGLLMRETIYKTSLCRSTLETTARVNLMRELTELKTATTDI
jgi:predicted metal-dependent HD superfamily phosphohydrolase